MDPGSLLSEIAPAPKQEDPTEQWEGLLGVQELGLNRQPLGYA
jgi:hypothetical protein